MTGTPQPVPPEPPEPAGTPWPGVSVVMPVRNEERHLRTAVAQVLSQDYPGRLELVVAVAPSRDRTQQIAEELVAEDARVRLVENPAGIAPTGLNAAIRATTYEVVVRVDGHGILSPGYIRRAVELLAETGADNVGGVMAAEGEPGFEEAAARAYVSPIGLGGARFHSGGEAGEVDSVYLGVFRRETLERLGGFDDTFVRAQDWELNHRIRQAGGTVWFSPELRVTYHPRSRLSDLVRQFYLTGKWRRAIGRTHPGTFNYRYLAPPLAVLGCGLGLVLGLAGLVAGLPWLLLGFVLPVGYLLAVLAASLVEGRGMSLRGRAWLPVVVATMHMTWGAGFLVSPRSLGRRTPQPTKV
ncbi:Glycosyltransferase, catalytic subunit of cellulose synthase and poly-beta-1,6-N-acetylglucosamine synthase [Actinopolymorpha cephalotaxi]|uniref:Glycosyltransferase involved in cell wall biosynthesis n=1 Tax=Actinopolymorpha cephalotaxi TaxID=504797 RepID=A0A1I2KTX6_9ACTN|nr:glycosyltransferase family 2 protein [Actinopolymorpha cephalotaxi]NYH84554.1 glycosyltransferase involved in cell wall biosynthesis [Actinopolymorpha cephalotaxi]SFF68376.1 Glycosyltransferase, catalytic subunit of cellulose synthase and poly-beta-1,6-N-acetylglucosamine synthase [Actinopolymorpha cephalotaxi]